MKETGSVAASDQVRERNYKHARLTLLGALSTGRPEDVRAAMTLTLDVLGIGERGDSELVWLCDAGSDEAFDLYAYKREDVRLMDAGLPCGQHVHEFYPLTYVQLIEIGKALLGEQEVWSKEVAGLVLKVITKQEAA